MKKIKEFLKFCLYSILNFTVNSTKKITPKTLLLLRLDAIGDYILFRNFIEVLRNSSKYKDHKITLVGNIVWKDLAENLDRDFIDEFIWIDIKKFHRNFVYRYKKLKEITSKGYEIIIHPTYSRTLNTDLIVKVVNANEKIGNSGDLSNIKAWQKRITDRYYTKLLSAKKGILFEFYRNKEFFENLLNQKIEIKKPYIKLSNSNLSVNIPNEFAILFIGASALFKKWPIEKYIKVGEYVYKSYKLQIVLCGGSSDIEDGYKFESLGKYPVINLVGNTKLIDLIKIINRAKIVVSNETGASHIAVALDTPVVVISNGSRFGRFTPYPSEITNKYYAIYPPEIESKLKEFDQLVNLYGMGSRLDISQIKVERVLECIDLVLAQEV